MAAERDTEFYLRVLRTLNEAQARWYVAREAVAVGPGRAEGDACADGHGASHDSAGHARTPSGDGPRRERASAPTGRRPEAVGGGRSDAGPRAREDHGRNDGERSDESPALDQQVDGTHRRGVDAP